MKLADNFELKEFNCKCGAVVPDEYVKNVIVLAWILQKIRTRISQPIFINSGYRTPAYNKKINGSLGSYHLTASAVDFFAPAMSAQQLYYNIVALMLDGSIPQCGIGIYDNFIHLDIRGNYNLFKY